MTKWTKEQEEAIYTSGSNIIVSAGAGSGKTAVLTERVLEKIKNGVSLSNLLILTFTKMAASEMKERIGDKLKKEGLTEELSLLDTADITTFDAYALSLVKKYHYYLNVSKDISVIDSSVIELYKREVLNDIFEDLYNKKDKEFLDLIYEYSLKDDREIFNFIININSKLDLKTNKQEYLDNYIMNKYNEDNIDRDIDLYTEEIFNLIDKIRNNLEYIDDSDYLDKLYSVLNPLFSSRTYDEIKINLEFKMPVARGVSDISKEYKEKISSLIKEIKELCSYSSSIDIKKGILKTEKYVKIIIDIIKELDRRVYEYKCSYDYFEYADIANLAIKLVRENKIVRDEIKNNLNEILIDEYQDTNDIQEEFISYIANNNVYMVGDIKQSIYRFRNANPYIFKNKYDKYSIGDGGVKIDLNKNFRSREEVIDNINLMFNKLMDNELGGASYSLSHQMIFGNMMYTGAGDNHQNNNFEVYSYLNDTNFKKEEVEAFIIAHDIKEKIKNKYQVFGKDTNCNRDIKYGDFVILMDNSKNFELFKKILEYEGIPTSIMKSSNLTDGEVILLIKNIVDFIIKINENKIDNEFKRLFMSLGRSFLFNISDDILFDYFLNNTFYDSEIYKITKEISDDIYNISLDELIDIILDKYDFYNKLILIGDYKANILRIDKLKEITSNLINLNYSIYDYQKYLDNIILNNMKIEYKVNENSTNTVKIMTIHASKGLEFNICYFVCLYNRFNIREAISKFSYDNRYGIIIPYKDDFIYNTIYHNLSYKDYVKENISERIRLFYVALTRAKEKMIFILPSNDSNKEITSDGVIDISIRSKYNSFASIMYSLEPLIKDYYKNIDLSNVNLTRNYNLIRNDNYDKKLKIVNNKIEVEEVNIKGKIKEDKSFSKKNNNLISLEEKRKLDYGKKLHEILELTDFNNINYEGLSSKEREVIDNFIKKIDINNANVYKEYEFIYTEDNTLYHGIIDLMLEYSDNIKIIDYKLKNISDNEYLKQLNGYKTYIEKTFKKKTSIYLYSIIDNVLEEIL